MKKKVASAVLAASLMGGAGVVTLVSTPMAAFAADTSTSTHTDATARSPARWATEALKGLVDKGTITQEQSNAVSKALDEARPPGGGHRGGQGGGFLISTKAAEVLGISGADLRTALDDGKSLAIIAKEHNIDVQKVIDVLVTEENTRIDKQVTDGKLTQAQADKRKAKTVERATARANNVMTVGGPGHGAAKEGQSNNNSTSS